MASRRRSIRPRRSTRRGGAFWEGKREYCEGLFKNKSVKKSFAYSLCKTRFPGSYSRIKTKQYRWPKKYGQLSFIKRKWFNGVSDPAKGRSRRTRRSRRN